VGVLRRATARVTDERLRAVGELLTGIRLVKLLGGEATFVGRIAGVRAREIDALRSAAIVRAVNTVAAFALPVMVTLATFGAVVGAGGTLTPSTAFVIVALFQVARFPLGVLPQAARCVAEARVAARRIQAFLELPEARPTDAPIALPRDAREDGAHATEAAARARAEEETGSGALPPADVGVALRDATFIWAAPEAAAAAAAAGAEGGATPSGDDAPPASSALPTPRALAGVYGASFSAPRGGCTLIVGPVASGKSTLLEALVGRTTRVGGAAFVRGRVAYCAQTPWIFAATFRDNVLFGEA
jgi:ATP-binding cassette, subfamily C (CFTR/MRP), member 1